MNTFIQLQCKTMITSIQIFLQACALAAQKDDGLISESEQKTLNEIRTAAARFVSELQKLL